MTQTKVCLCDQARKPSAASHNDSQCHVLPLNSGREILRQEIQNMLMYYKKAKLIFHRRITAQSQNPSAESDGENSKAASKDSQKRSGKTLSFTADSGSRLFSGSTTTVMMQGSGRDYTLGGASSRSPSSGSAGDVTNAYSRESLYCEWYSQVPMYVSDEVSRMGTPDFRRFLKAVGINMSGEEAGTIFYAILHHGNSTSPSSRSPPTTAGRSALGADGPLQLLPRIGFLQFDRFVQQGSRYDSIHRSARRVTCRECSVCSCFSDGFKRLFPSTRAVRRKPHCLQPNVKKCGEHGSVKRWFVLCACVNRQAPSITTVCCFHVVNSQFRARVRKPCPRLDYQQSAASSSKRDNRHVSIKGEMPPLALARAIRVISTLCRR